MHTTSRQVQITWADRRLTVCETAAVFHAVKHGEVVLPPADTLELLLALTVISAPCPLSRREALVTDFFQWQDGTLEWITA